MSINRIRWHNAIESLLNGVDRELRSTAPIKLRASLAIFRQRLNRDSMPRRRKRFEQELNAFLNSNPSLRAATKRYLSKRIKRLVRAGTELSNKAERVLRRMEKKQIVS